MSKDDFSADEKQGGPLDIKWTGYEDGTSVNDHFDQTSLVKNFLIPEALGGRSGFAPQEGTPYGQFPDVDSQADPAADTTVKPSQSQRTLASLLDPSGQAGASDLKPGTLAKKTTGGGMSGSVSVTKGPPIPEQLLNQQAMFARAQAHLQAQLHTERAKTLGIMVDFGQEFAQDIEENTEETLKAIDESLTKAEEEVSAMEDLVDAALSNRINPGQFFANVGAAGRFASALAVAGGAASAAVLGGGPNHAYNIITRAIDRNVRAQVINQTHDRAMISHQMNLVNMFRGLSNDRAQYGNYVRMALAGVAKAHMGVEMNKLGQVQSQIAARQTYAQLGAYLVEQQIKAHSNMAARYTFNWKNASQYAQVRRMVEGPAAGQPQAKPIAAGRGGPARGQPQPTAPTATPAQGIEDEGSAMSMPVEGQGPGAAPIQQTQVDGKPRYTTTLSVGADGPAVLPIKQDYEQAFADIWFHPEKGPKAREEVSAALASLKDASILLEGLRQGGFVTSDNAFLKHLIVDKYGDLKMKAFLDLPERERQAAVEQLTKTAIKQAHLQDTGNARNAMNLPWERDFARAIGGMEMTVFDYLANLSEPDTRHRIIQTGLYDVRSVENLGRVMDKYYLDSKGLFK